MGCKVSCRFYTTRFLLAETVSGQVRRTGPVGIPARHSGFSIVAAPGASRCRHEDSKTGRRRRRTLDMAIQA